MHKNLIECTVSKVYGLFHFATCDRSDSIMIQPDTLYSMDTEKEVEGINKGVRLYLAFRAPDKHWRCLPACRVLNALVRVAQTVKEK